MYSLSFPKIFDNSRCLINKDKDATLTNLILLLKSDKYSLIGDPYFGTLLKSMIYEQSDAIFRDLLIDEIFTAISTFLPQIKLQRKDITVDTDGIDVYAKITCINLLDYTTNMYTINLTSGD